MLLGRKCKEGVEALSLKQRPRFKEQLKGNLSHVGVPVEIRNSHPVSTKRTLQFELTFQMQFKEVASIRVE
jgi:hypothetical protein